MKPQTQKKISLPTSTAKLTISVQETPR